MSESGIFASTMSLLGVRHDRHRAATELQAHRLPASYRLGSATHPVQLPISWLGFRKKFQEPKFIFFLFIFSSATTKMEVDPPEPTASDSSSDATRPQPSSS